MNGICLYGLFTPLLLTGNTVIIAIHFSIGTMLNKISGFCARGHLWAVLPTVATKTRCGRLGCRCSNGYLGSRSGSGNDHRLIIHVRGRNVLKTIGAYRRWCDHGCWWDAAVGGHKRYGSIADQYQNGNDNDYQHIFHICSIGHKTPLFWVWILNRIFARRFWIKVLHSCFKLRLNNRQRTLNRRNLPYSYSIRLFNNVPRCYFKNNW